MIRLTGVLLISLGALGACQTGGVGTAANQDMIQNQGSLANPTDGFETGEPDV